MRKPWENRNKLRDGRRTISPQNSRYVSCIGSHQKPIAYRREEIVIVEDGHEIFRVEGKCRVCGRWCICKENDTMPRHKQLSPVVQDWEKHEYP